MPEQAATKLYLKLKEYCRTTGMSPSTVERRIRDGSITCLQLGGRKTLRLFAVSDLMAKADRTASLSTADESAKGDGAVVHSRHAATPTNQRRPLAKWKRELDALQVCSRNPTPKK
jgi:hypothetical protein